MRLLLLALLGPLLYGASWKQVEKITSATCGNRTFILEVSSDWGGGGEFNRLRIQSQGQPEFSVTTDDGWTKHHGVSGPMFPKDLSLRLTNRLPSQYLYCISWPATNPQQTLVFIFGWPYEDGPPSLDIIRLYPSSAPQVAFHGARFGLADVTDLDNDGAPDLAGRECYVERWGERDRYLTYAPYRVYRLAPNREGVYSEALSRDYNQQHYYGWAGPQCSQDFVVDLRAAGKPALIKTPPTH